MPNKLVMFVGLSVLGTAWAVPAAEVPEPAGPKQTFDVTNTEHVPFASGGTIRFIDSYGYLSVEGWDEPEVQVTVIKSTNKFYEPSQQDEAKARLERIRVTTERRSDTELAITTLRASRNGGWAPPLPKTTKAGVTVELRVLVPRDSRLVIRHDNGYVWVSDVTGDVEVRSSTGDMIVELPDPGPYVIDARTRLGSISSDLIGKGRNQYLVGTRFGYMGEAPARRIYLRMGRGSISVKKGPPSAPFGKD
jgi:hypothetical protein